MLTAACTSWLRVGGVISSIGTLASCADTPRPTTASLVATIRQAGPVGYRDPIGVISPDGRRLATVIPHELLVHDLQSGVARSLPLGGERILHLAWRGDRDLVLGQPDSGVVWWIYEVDRGARRPLWPSGAQLTDSAGQSVEPSALRDLSWSADFGRGVGVELRPDGSRLWTFDANGLAIAARSFTARLGYPAWMPDGRIACLAVLDGRQRLTLPCGETVPAGLENHEAYGPIASSPDGREVFVALAGDSGFVRVWAWNLTSGKGRIVAARERDTYTPSVSRDGTLLYKDQDYWTEVMVMPSDGGTGVQRTSFQGETPSWDPTGTQIGITYGTWRRVSDDFRYPDIAQDAGIIAADGTAPASSVDQVVQSSESEDQGLTWSPNRRWIAFHSHQQNSDDIWLRPADRPGPPTRISFLGRGAEVGWPRWSPDGRWVVFDGDAGTGAGRRSMVWIVGVDQNTGRVTEPAHPVPITGLTDPVVHAEWLGGSDEIVYSTTRSPTRHTLYRVARTGGVPRVIHEYTSPQRVDGFGVDPGGRWLVFPAPDPNGRLQLFRVATDGGGHALPLTSDSTDKTQPSVSPDGRKIAYTSWRYLARFWTLKL